jgi:hypothetical protein
MVNCEISTVTPILSTSACQEQKDSVSECASSFPVREFRSAKGLFMRAKILGQRTTSKQGDSLSLRGGGGCLSFPRKATQQKKDRFVSFQLDVFFNTSVLNFTQFSPGILGSCEILGKWKENQVRVMQLLGNVQNLPLSCLCY